MADTLVESRIPFTLEGLGFISRPFVQMMDNPHPQWSVSLFVAGGSAGIRVLAPWLLSWTTEEQGILKMSELF
jgi:hypothetical protein